MLLSGNLTRDPDLRFTPSGSAVANFNIAVNRNYQNKKTMEWVENTDFYRIITWYKLAENCAESLKKGDRVVAVSYTHLDVYKRQISGFIFNFSDIS